MNLRLVCAFFVVVVGSWLSQAPADDAVLLKYKLAQGDKLFYKTTQDLKQAQSVMGMKFDNTMKNEAVIAKIVDAVDADGNATLKVKCERRKVKAEFGAVGKFEFDSKSSERDAASAIGAAVTPILERLTGSEYEVIVNPRGKVTEVKGYAELTADLIKDSPLGGQFAAADNKSAIPNEQGGFITLSDKPVKPGDQWEVPLDLELSKVGKMKGKTTYTYEGPDKVGDRKTARIGISTEMTLELNIDQAQSKVTGTLTVSSSSGTAQFDPEAGRLISIKQSNSMSGKLTVEAGGMMIPLDNEQETTDSAELLDKLPE